MRTNNQRGRTRKYTQAQVKEVRELREAGMAFKDIAELTNIPSGSLGAIALGTGHYSEKIPVTVKRRKEVSRIEDPTKAMLLLFCQGKNVEDIAKITNTHVMVVNTIIEDAKKLNKISQVWTINS